MTTCGQARAAGTMTETLGHLLKSGLTWWSHLSCRFLFGLSKCPLVQALLLSGVYRKSGLVLSLSLCWLSRLIPWNWHRYLGNEMTSNKLEARMWVALETRQKATFFFLKQAKLIQWKLEKKIFATLPSPVTSRFLLATHNGKAKMENLKKKQLTAFLWFSWQFAMVSRETASHIH